MDDPLLLYIPVETLEWLTEWIEGYTNLHTFEESNEKLKRFVMAFKISTERHRKK